MDDGTTVTDAMLSTQKELNEKVEKAWEVIDKLTLDDLRQQLQLISNNNLGQWKRAAELMEPLLVKCQEKRIKQCRSLVLKCVRPLVLSERTEALEAAVQVFRERVDAIGLEMVLVWKRLDRKTPLAADEIYSQTFRDMGALLESKCASSKTWLSLEVESKIVLEKRGHQLETASIRAAEAAERAASANEEAAQASIVATLATQRAADASMRAADATSIAGEATERAAEATERAAVAAEDATRASRRMVAVTVIFIVVTALGSIGSIWYARLTYYKPDPKPQAVTVTVQEPSEEWFLAAQGSCLGLKQCAPMTNLKSDRVFALRPAAVSISTKD